MENLHSSISDLIARLVQIPSRAGIDSCDEIFALLIHWFSAHGIQCTALRVQDRGIVALVGHTGGDHRELPAYVLNATVDTAGFGDTGSWSENPVSAKIIDGWMYGRGTADSKAGLAIFSHLVVAFKNRNFSRPLGFAFDSDEHTGGFGGIRSALDFFQGRIAGVMIGYPGNDNIGIGARGFWRACVQLHGVSAHSGSVRHHGVNAIDKAARLIEAISQLHRELSATRQDVAHPPSSATVTGIRGGGEFSSVPDSCEVDLDIRLTNSFSAQAAADRINDIVAKLDAEAPGWKDSQIAVAQALPAYDLPQDSPLLIALKRASEEVLGHPVPHRITGPSNVGNLLAQRNIPATCGFGVSYRNIHAPDECIELKSLEPVYRVYERALELLLGMAN